MEPPCEGECWNISELSTSPHKLKLLGWIGRCMHLNIYNTLTLCTLTQHTLDKNGVYSFGVLLEEMLKGKKPFFILIL